MPRTPGSKNKTRRSEQVKRVRLETSFNLTDSQFILEKYGDGLEEKKAEIIARARAELLAQPTTKPDPGGTKPVMDWIKEIAKENKSE
jgi:hypothetical protein